MRMPLKLAKWEALLAPAIVAAAVSIAAAASSADMAPAANRAAAGPQKADGSKALDSLAFLLGDWDASGQGQPGQGAGRYSFRQDLQERVIVRSSFAEYPAAGDRPATRHDDLMVIYADGNALRADYYDSEGHVIRYAIATPTAASAVFTSDVAAAQARYRLSYALQGDVLQGTFEIAPPGKPDAFQRYLSWQSRRAAKS